MSRKHADKSLADPAEIDPALRHHLIREAAYALHEKKGFRHGEDLDDWLIAEAYVDDSYRLSMEARSGRARARVRHAASSPRRSSR